MDKIVDAGNTLSLVSGSKSDKKKDGKVEGDAFAKVLEQQTGKSEKASDNARQSIVADKTEKNEKPKPGTAAAADLEARLKGKLATNGTSMTGMANYIYNIVLKSPDSLSMAEKQSFQVAEFNPDSVGMKEFQQMLTERGIRLNDLSYSTVAQLTQRNSRGDVTAFLDDLLSQMREGTLERRGTPQPNAVFQTAGTTEKRDRDHDKDAQFAAELRTDTEVRTDTQPVLGQVEGQTPQQARDTRLSEQRREQRENVIQQIIAKMEIQTVGEKTEMTLKLNPEYLGEMRVKLSTENGKLAAEFETTSAEVRELVEEGWEGLKETFSRKGLNLAQVSTRLVDTLN
jgi:flagellar hook-length control protein FliK